MDPRTALCLALAALAVGLSAARVRRHTARAPRPVLPLPVPPPAVFGAVWAVLYAGAVADLGLSLRARRWTRCAAYAAVLALGPAWAARYYAADGPCGALPVLLLMLVLVGGLARTRPAGGPALVAALVAAHAAWLVYASALNTSACIKNRTG